MAFLLHIELNFLVIGCVLSRDLQNSIFTISTFFQASSTVEPGHQGAAIVLTTPLGFQDYYTGLPDLVM